MSQSWQPGRFANDRLVGAGLVSSVGGVLTVVPIFDIWEDAAVQGKPVFSTLLENSVLLALTLGLVAAGMYLLRTDLEDEYVFLAGKRTVVVLAGLVMLLGWILGIQLYLQAELKPRVIAADAVLIGGLVAFVVGLYDARRQAGRDTLTAERNRFAALFENIPAPVVVVQYVDDEPIVRAVNAAFEEVYDDQHERLEGRNLNSYMRPDDGEGTVKSVDIEGDSGRWLPDGWQGQLIRVETGSGVREFVRLQEDLSNRSGDPLGIYMDVTAERQREEQLFVLTRVLRHNLRNRLNVVVGYADRLRARLDGERAALADTVVEAATDLYETTEHAMLLKDMAADEISRQPVELVRYVEDAAVATEQSNPDCSVETDLPDEAWVYGTSALSVAVEEVVENAVEHNDSDHPTVNVTVEKRPDASVLELRVADDGPGIPPEEREVVLGEVERDQLTHGSGLGLWAVNWVVTDCGGDLQFEENDPRGSVVVLRLPLSVESAEFDGRYVRNPADSTSDS